MRKDHVLTEKMFGYISTMRTTTNNRPTQTSALPQQLITAQKQQKEIQVCCPTHEKQTISEEQRTKSTGNYSTTHKQRAHLQAQRWIPCASVLRSRQRDRPPHSAPCCARGLALLSLSPSPLLCCLFLSCIFHCRSISLLVSARCSAAQSEAHLTASEVSLLPMVLGFAR